MTTHGTETADPALRYVQLGLRLGRHNPDLVDAYYGPAGLRRAVDDEPVVGLGRLVADCRSLIAELDAGASVDGDGRPIDGQRRAWLRAQLVGLESTIVSMSGEPMSYVDEVRASFGVEPHRVEPDEIESAQRELDRVLPGSGDLRERMIGFRDRHSVPTDRLERLIGSIAEDFRDRTRATFGLPEGESVRFDLVTDKPWSGFNYYAGDLSSLVAINVDLPVASYTLGHLIAHEAYPGHHTEGCRKEVGLARARNQVEETVALIGTPSNTIAEGLADLALEVLVGDHAVSVVGDHARAHGVVHEDEPVVAIAGWSEMSSRVRGNLALMLHADGVGADEVVEIAQRWLLVDRQRAEKAVQFLLDPTWRAYIFCYIEGLDRCRRFTGGRPERFRRLLDEQLTPADLDAA